MTTDGPTLVDIGGGRVLAVDDVGDPDGVPVLHLHGVPGSRLSRHPDDALSAAAGVRLVAVDRPGCGRSTPDAGRTLGTTVADLVALLDALGLDRVAVLAWSAGAPFAVALAVAHPERVTAVGLTAPAVPITAYADAAVAEVAGPGRMLFAEMAAEMTPADVAAEVAPFLPTETPAELECVALGRAGLEAEVAIQAAVPDVDLTALPAEVPVTIWAGAADEVAPPGFAGWWTGVVPHATLHVLPDEDHELHLRHWPEILATTTR